MNMKPKKLCCQDCGLKFENLSAYKKHVRKNGHQQQVATLFQTAPHKGPVHLPHIVVLEYLFKVNRAHPVIGLQMVSLCISTEMDGPPFYLCHACQEKCPSGTMLSHLKSTEHYFSVFAYMNPELLHFGWQPPMETVPGLKRKAEVEEKQQGTGVLKVIDIPKTVFGNMKTSPYSQTMKELTQSDKLKEVCTVDQPERMTLQEYLKKTERTHPLLGLQFLVEYSRADNRKLCGYLCLLCKKRVRDTQVIAHIIGFDHVFWYLDLVHPSSLAPKSCYKPYSAKCSSVILDLAKQAQEIGTSGEVQEVKLDPAVFAAVDFGSFAKALDLLQTVRKKQNQSDLQPIVTPGRKLVAGTCQMTRGPRVPPVAVQKTQTDPQKDTVKDVVQSPSAPREHTQDLQSTNTESEKAVPCEVQNAPAETCLTNFGLSCLDCGPGALFVFMSEYKKHVRGGKHKQRMESLFRTVLNRTTVPVPSLVVYEYLVKPYRGDPVIGLQLVTACVDTEIASSPTYLCHACQDKCSSHFIMAHLTSSDHYFSVLALMNPERLHFGWIPSRDMLSLLKPQAQAEEKQRGVGMLQVLDMPERMHKMIRTTPYFPSMRIICETEDLKERLRVKKWITLQEYCEKQNRKHPMLGLQFLVEYSRADNRKLCGYLCLLCKKRVRDTQVIAHVVGFNHIFSYLDLAHPSSLACKSHYKHYDAEYSAMILDLAKQAQQIDSTGKAKVITLDPAIYEEVESSEFSKALSKLQTIWGEQNQSDLQPLVTPGHRLVPKLQKKAKASEPKKPALSSEVKNLSQTSKQKRPGHSSELLWNYLKNKQRTEPVIGLNAVIECANDDQPPYYLCVACAEKMPQSSIIDHLISPSHRYLYLKSQHRLSGWEETPDLTKMISPLKEMATALEQEKGYGEAQVLELDATQYKGIISSTIDVALNSLQTIQEKQSDPQPLVDSEGVKVTVKEEMVQSQVTPHAPNQGSQSTVSVKGKTVRNEEVPRPALDLKHTEKSLFIGEQSQTQTSTVLWRYLSSKLRKEPVIGLTTVIEYQTDNQPGFLECKACAKTLRTEFVIGHVIGSRHRYSYIRSAHPDLLEGWKENPDLTGNIDKLQAIARVLEQKEGWGQFKVIKVEKDAVTDREPISTMKVTADQTTKAVAHCVPAQDFKSPKTKRVDPIQAPAQGRSSFASAYLSKKMKGKKEPIIGLRMVTECRSINEQVIYICEVCRARIPKIQILQHVTHVLHRYNYIKAQYPSLMKKDVKKSNLTTMSGYFQNLARTVAQKEKDIGDVQVIELDGELYKELFSISYDNALSKLQKIREEQKQNRNITKQTDVKDLNHRLHSSSPEPAPKQPCPSTPPSDAAQEETSEGGGGIEASVTVDLKVPETVAVKQEAVDSGVVLLDPDSTETKTVTVKQEKVESRVFPEAPVQTQTGLDTQLATGIEEKTAGVPAPPPPVQDQKHTDTVTVREDMGQSPPPLLKTVPGSRGTETNPVTACEERVRWQMGPRVSLQRPQITTRKRAAVPLGESHLAKFMLPFLTHKQEPLVGLRAVVECRSFKQPTFYLCLTCAEKISKNHMCNHIISSRHQYHYIECEYPDLLLDWERNPTDVAWWVEDHERVWDAQVVKLDLDWYTQVASASFDIALKKLQMIQREQSQSDLRPLMTPGQRLVFVHKRPFRHQEPQQEHLWDLHRTQSHRDTKEESIQHPATPPVPGSDKRVQSPSPPQEPSRDAKHTETLQVTYREKTAEGRWVHQVPVREYRGADPTKVAVREGAVLRQASEAAEAVTVERATRTSVDLRDYVEDPQRTQPVVGLSALIECRSENQPPLYLCLACSTQLSKPLVICHVIGHKHRLGYLCPKRPDLFRGWSNSQDSAKMSSDLMEIAREVEDQEQPNIREIQEVSLDSAAYAEVKSMPFDKALELVQMIRKQQNQYDLRPLMTPGQRQVTVKQEKVEFPEAPVQAQTGLDTQLDNVKMERDQWQADTKGPIQHSESPDREHGVHEEKPQPVATGTRQECQSNSVAKMPVIGLQSVMECRSVEGWPPPCFYLCRACSVKLPGGQRSLSQHLSSTLHQFCYIKSHHSRRLEMEKKAGSITCGMADLVQFVAKRLEEEEGPGSVQVMNMSEGIYNRLKKGNYEYCMNMLKSCGSVKEKQKCSNRGERNMTATRGPEQTPQSLDSGSDNSCNGIVRHGPPSAEMKSQGETCQNLWPKVDGAPGDGASHHPSNPRSQPSADPLAPHRSDQISCKTSEPQSRPPRHAFLTYSSPKSNDTPPESLCYHPAGPTEPISTHEPCQTAGYSDGTNTRRSSTSKGETQGVQISTVLSLYSHIANQGLTVGGAVKRKSHREESEDEDPWNYENRQFTPDREELSEPWGKRIQVVHNGRASTQPAPLSVLPPPQTDAQAQRASGEGKVVMVEQESLMRGTGEFATIRLTSSKAARTPDGQSRFSATPSPFSGAAVSGGRVPHKVTLLGKRLRQSSSAQHQAKDRKHPNSDPPPVKIPGLDHTDSAENPTEKLLTCWKEITGERRA